MHAEGREGTALLSSRKSSSKSLRQPQRSSPGPRASCRRRQEGVDDAAAEPDKSWQQGCLDRRELGPAWHDGPDFFLCYSLQHAC